jgi:hypothetical protein
MKGPALDIFRFAEQLMLMDEDTWQRHAHPFSVWSRVFLGLPLLVLAVWSRAWIGGWALLALAAALGFIWLNPRMAPIPKHTDNWASKAVFGERVWLNRKSVPIPECHRVAPHLLTAVSALGIPFLIWGLYALAIWPTLFGAALIYLGKMWFVDRMVWLYEDMKGVHPEYAAWLR